MSARTGHLTLLQQSALPDPFAVAPIPDAPPPEVLAEVDAAAARVDALAARDRELHFDLDGAGRAVVELRSRGGATIRRVTGTEALAIMAGLANVD